MANRGEAENRVLRGKTTTETTKTTGIINGKMHVKTTNSTDVRPSILCTYVQRVYGRTALGCQDVRPKGAWTYVHRTFERW